MKKKRKASTPTRRDILSCEGDRRRDDCWRAVAQIETALKAIKQLNCNLDARMVSILMLSAAAMGEITERG
jgi:hypothetical protein